MVWVQVQLIEEWVQSHLGEQWVQLMEEEEKQQADLWEEEMIRL